VPGDVFSGHFFDQRAPLRVSGIGSQIVASPIAAFEKRIETPENTINLQLTESVPLQAPMATATPGRTMPLGHPANPLHRSALFRTSDPGEFENAVTQFGAMQVEISPSGAFEAQGSLLQLQDIVLLFAASNSSLAVRYPEFDFARMSIPLGGRGDTVIGNETVGIDERQSCVTSPGRATLVRCDAEHGWLNLRVKATALEKKLGLILGAKPKGNLQFRPHLDLDHPRSKSLCQLVGFFARQLNSTASEMPAVGGQELEQAIVTAFLLATRHTFSGSLEQESREAAPWQVRRVEDYIEANWNRPIRIEALVEHTGLSTRAIFRAFQRNRGYSPMVFAKMVRLQRARAQLANPDGTTTVTAVAFNCGFANLGHFAREYREAFGQLPSETLAGSRPATVN
jgi:AraC-like DNA-binding protein